MNVQYLILVYVLLRICAVAFLITPGVRRFRTINDRRMPLVRLRAEANTWWLKDELNFKCTGCGKCCSNDGEVWLDKDEFVEIADSMDLSFESFLEDYSTDVKMDWVKIKEKEGERGKSCIFLGDDGKTCKIYKHRPVHCRTYPFWPSLLVNKATWDSEMVVPDNVPGMHWSPEGGGCEGMTKLVGEGENPVSPTWIFQNLKLDEQYTESFPFLESGDDKNRLLAKANILRKVLKATRSWVMEYVVKYRLCPFVDQVFKDGSIRYRIYLDTSEAKILERVKYEVSMEHDALGLFDVNLMTMM
jgi:uncharacterized protein